MFTVVRQQIEITEKSISNKIEHDKEIDNMLEKINSKYDFLKEILKGMLLWRFNLKECFDMLGYDISLSKVYWDIIRETQVYFRGGNEGENALPPENIASVLGTFSEAEFEIIILKIKKAKDFLSSKQAHSEELAELESNSSAIKNLNNDYLSYSNILNEIKSKFESIKNEFRQNDVENFARPEIYFQSRNIQAPIMNSNQKIYETNVLLQNYIQKINFSNRTAINQGPKQQNSDKTIYYMKYLESGEIYIGSFQRGLREGMGVIIYPDSSIYEGYFRKDSKKYFKKRKHISKYSYQNI